MADEAAQAESGDAAGVSSGGGGRSRGWRDLWQAPALLLGVGLIAAGVMFARGTEREDDYAGVLNDARALIERNEYDRAIGLLNGTILPRLEAPQMTPRLRQEFHLLRGDAVALGQSDRMINNRANNALIAKEYREAESLLADIGPERQARMADALISLGELDEAERRMKQLPASMPDRKRALAKRLVEAHRGRGEPGREKSLELLSGMASDAGLGSEDRVWALARQAELRIDAGYPEAALEGLLRAVHRLETPDASGTGSLYLLLARAYHELGRLDEAWEQLERARRLLPEQDARRGTLLALSGEIAMDRGDLPAARDYFWRAVEEHPESGSFLRSLMGVAEIDSRLGDVADSLEAYDRLVTEFDRARGGGGPAAERVGYGADLTAERVAENLLAQHGLRRTGDDYESAIEYAKLADRLFDYDGTPPPVVLALAEAHRARAEELVEEAGVDPTRPAEIAAIDPVTRAEIRAHYLDAGEHFLRHARQTVLSDDLAFTDSLWMAGDSYDKAGETAKTIEIFSEYAAGLDDDPRLTAALFRLAGAHQAQGDYRMASELYGELIEDHPNTSEAAAAHVRLAQCRVLDADEENDGEARALLERILSSGRLAPDAVEFRDALVQLGRIHLRAGRHDEAMARLGEAVERYPGDAESALMRFQLADAHRLAAERVEDELEHESMPAGRRRDLRAQREGWLRDALSLYEEVRSELDAIDERRRTDLQDLVLRNAHLYRADCAYDLGEYETAIRLYDAAAQRYAGDPASLVAMVQIVNCYVRMDRLEEARTANERARRRLRELPPGALDEPDVPMTRRHWERWLDSAAALDALAEAGGG